VTNQELTYAVGGAVALVKRCCERILSDVQGPTAFAKRAKYIACLSAANFQ
jgi:hypothetical protein